MRGDVRSRTIGVAALLALALLTGIAPAARALCPADGATTMNIGPLSPETTFPLWVQDSTGLTLEICPGTDPVHCISVPPIDGVPFSQQIGFGDEGFWASAEAFVGTSGGGQAALVSAVEAAFLPTFADGNQFPFTRLRIRVDVAEAGLYTVTHPWGQIQYNVDTPGPNAINESLDIQFFPNQVGYLGRIGPVLTWDTFNRAANTLPDTAGGALVGHIGDLASPPHAVTGSPCGTNFFRVDGPNIGGPGVNFVQTDLFTVTGKVYTGVAPAPLFVDRTSYARTVNGQVDVFAASAPGATVTVNGDPNLGGPHTLTGDGTGLFFASVPVGDTSILPATVTVSASNPGNNNTNLIRPLTDLVTVTRAQYDRTTRTLTVNAISSDQSTPPTLSLVGFGPFLTTDLAGGTVAFGPVAAPPANVIVLSTAGGQAILPVTVVSGAAPGNTPPLAANDPANTNEDTAVVIAVLANDSDANSPANTIDNTTVTIGGTGPANGTAVVNLVTGAVTYTPRLNFNGNDSFTYVVQDTLGAFSNVATVSITVNPVNDPPTAVNDVASVNINNSVIISVLANDTDPEGNISPSTVTIVTPPAPALGTATPQANGTVIFAAGGAPGGVATFTYTVADGAGGVSNLATVTVNVNNVAAEVVTITLAEFRTGQSRWRITGTTTVPGPGNQMTARLQRTGQTIGSAAVTAVGAFTISVRPSPVVPDIGDVVVVTSTFGGTAQQTVSIRN
jgi:hypothetical protein